MLANRFSNRWLGISLFACISFAICIFRLSFLDEILLIASSAFLIFLILNIKNTGFKSTFHSITSTEKKKAFLLIIVFEVLTFCVLIIWKFSAYSHILSLFLKVLVFDLLGIFVAFVTFLENKESLHKVYFVLGITLGLSLFAIIPVGVVPDEAMHIYSSYAVSNKMLGLDKMDNEDGILMRNCDSAFEFYTDQNYYNNDNYNKYIGAIDSQEDIYTSSYFPCPYIQTNTYLYIISAIGITIGRVLNFNCIETYLTARLLNLLFFVYITAFAIKKIKYGKILLFTIALLPCTVQQGMAVTYDVPINLMFFLIFTYLVNSFYCNDQSLTILDKLLFALCSIGLILVKSHAYIFIAVLPIVLMLWRKIYSIVNKKIVYFTLMLSIIGVVSIFAYYKLQPSISLAETSYYTLGYLFQNPKEIFAVIYNTVVNTGSFYLDTFVGRYLGYLSISIHPLIIYMYYFVLIVSSCLKYDEKILISKNEKFLFLLVSMIETIAMLVGMLLANSVISDHQVLGMQGRYLMPCILLMLFCFQNNLLKVAKNRDSVVFGLLTAISITTICNIMFVE